MELCSIPGCHRNKRKRGWCTTHYMRWTKHGDPHIARYKAPAGAPLQWIRDNVGYEDDDCLEWPYAKYENGYAMINAPGRKPMGASRYMCIQAHGEPPRIRMDAAHSCGNGHLACCNPNHLRWASRTSNLEDRKEHGTLPLGEKHHNSKLTENAVREIRKLRDIETQSSLGKRFGVSFQTISEIQLNKKWTHVVG